MKKISLSFIILLFIGNPASFGQMTDTTALADSVIVTKPKVKKPARNFIKVNLMNLALRNYSFQYERALSKRFSVALGYRLMPTGGIPLWSTIETMVDITDKDVKDALTKVQVTNTAITPELRLYVGRKGYGRGFYLAPFYRYSVYETASLPIKVDNNTRSVNLSGKLTTHTFGLQLGAQWMLSKRISLDWWIIGPQFGTHKSEFAGVQDTDFTQSEKDDIEQFFKDVSFPNLNLTSPPPTNNSISVSTTGPWAGIRTGLCIGVRF
jgi:hypothetical protein